MKKYYSEIVLGLLALVIANSNLALAMGDAPAAIIGNRISLFERGHTFAGSIAEIPAFGVFEESDFGAKVEMRRGGKTLVLTLSKNGQHYSGDIVEAQLRQLSTHIELDGVKKTGPNEGQINLRIDGKAVEVKVSAKSFEGGHFQAPHYEAVIDGVAVAFDFSGQACFGYSANIAMMILGPYAHLNK